MVSSYKDCNSQFIYPTPQLPLKDRHYENLHLFPDPSIFKAGGVLIGVTSTDILMHIGREEISRCVNQSSYSRTLNFISAYPCFLFITVRATAQTDCPDLLVMYSPKDPFIH